MSDIHYASAAEQARGNDYEYRNLPNPLLRLALRFHRRVLWLKDPLNQNYLLDRFLSESSSLDCVIANGDYSCNSAFVGLSDDAAFQSASECLAKIRQKFGANVHATIGDHEFGKFSFLSHRGGMRLESWRRAQNKLALRALWQVSVGNYVLLGVASSLIALPVFESEMLETERQEWEVLRAKHMEEVCGAFERLQAKERVLLFCHDPTALPFLWREDTVRARLPQVEQTVIGHLHSNLILRQSRWLAGMPAISFLGHSVRRFSAALREARHWQPFKVRLCPSLAGIELLKDGGYYTAELDPEARQPIRFTFHPLPRR